MCQNPEKYQSPELATPENYRVQNLGEFRGGKFRLYHVLGVARYGLCHLIGLLVWQFFLWIVEHR